MLFVTLCDMMFTFIGHILVYTRNILVPGLQLWSNSAQSQQSMTNHGSTVSSTNLHSGPGKWGAAFVLSLLQSYQNVVSERGAETMQIVQANRQQHEQMQFNIYEFHNSIHQRLTDFFDDTNIQRAGQTMGDVVTIFF